MYIFWNEITFFSTFTMSGHNIFLYILNILNWNKNSNGIKNNLMNVKSILLLYKQNFKAKCRMFRIIWKQEIYNFIKLKIYSVDIVRKFSDVFLIVQKIKDPSNNNNATNIYSERRRKKCILYIISVFKRKIQNINKVLLN